MNKKQIAIALVLLICLLPFLIQPIAKWALGNYVARKVGKAGWDLSYNALELHKDGFSLLQPSLASKEGGQEVSKADKILFNVSLGSFPFSLNIACESLEICTEKELFDFEKIKKSFRGSKMVGGGSFLITQGVLKSGNELLPFSSEFKWGKNPYASCHFGDENAYLTFHLDESRTALTAKNCELGAFEPLIHFLAPKTASLNLSGRVEGALSFVNSSFAADSRLLLSSMTVSDPLNQAHLSFEKVKISPAKGLEALVFDGEGGVLQMVDGGKPCGLEKLFGTLTTDFSSTLSCEGEGSLVGGLEAAVVHFTSQWNTSLDSQNNGLIEITPLNRDSRPTKVGLHSLQGPEPLTRLVRLELEHLRPLPLHLTQKLVNYWTPELNPVDYIAGSLSGIFEFTSVKETLHSITAKNVEIEKGLIYIRPWEIALGADSLKGELYLDASALRPLDSLEGSLYIENGQAALTSIGLDAWHFTEIQTHLEIEKGELKASSASIALAGLKGKAEIGHGQGEIMHLSLHGKASDLAPFLPQKFRKGVQIAFSDDAIEVEAKVMKSLGGVEIKGRGIDKNNLAALPPMDFSFLIEKPHEKVIKNITLNEEVWLQGFTEEVASSLSPARDHLALKQMMQDLNASRGLAGFTIRKGAFSIKQAPLETFISPFLFPDGDIKASGVADIKGSFDINSLDIEYTAQNAVLSSDGFTINLEEMGGPAFHFVDFNSQKHFGRLPVVHARYFDAHSGLLFNPIEGIVIFEDDTINIEKVTAYCQGLVFKGEIEIDYSPPGKGVFDTSIKIDQLFGTFTNAHQFLAHFNAKNLLAELPLEGKIGLREEGGLVEFKFRPEDYDVQVKMAGNFTEGTLKCSTCDISVHEMGFNFDFDHQNNFLSLKDLQGILLLGKTEPVEEYALYAEEIAFNDFKSSCASFDVHIKDESKIFARIAGKSSLDHDNKGIFLEFCPEKSFLGDLKFKKFDFILLDWNRLEDLNFESSFRLSTLLHEMDKLSPAHLPFVQETAKGLHAFSTLGGEVALSLKFDDTNGSLRYSLTGQDLLLGEHQVHTFKLDGSKQDNLWNVENFQLDHLSASAQLSNLGNHWKADFLGLRWGDKILLGMNGSYDTQASAFHAHVNLLEADLKTLASFSYFDDILETLKPQGSIKGVGEIMLKKDPAQGFVIDALLEISTRELALNQFHFRDVSRVSLHFASDRGWSLKNISTALSSEGTELAEVTIPELSYDLASESFQLNPADFSINKNSLSAVKTAISPLIVSLGDLSALDEIALKRDSLKGKLALEFSPSTHQIALELDSDTYVIRGKEWDLKNIRIEASEEEALFYALTLLGEVPVWVSARINFSEPDKGTVILADTSHDETEKPALMILWRLDPLRGLIIEKATGNLRGLGLHLTESSSNPSTQEAFHLEGIITADFKQAAPLLPALLNETVTTFDLGKGFQLQGSLEIEKEPQDGTHRTLRVFGNLEGTDVEIKGYKFQQLSSQLFWDDHSFQLVNFTLSDPSAQIYTEHIRADQMENGAFWLQMPLLTIQEARPSLLREVNPLTPPLKKPLVIRQLYLQNLRGIVGDAASFKGEGRLYFENPQKKNLQNTLFAIPGEILTRIGLNLAVLTPVSGQINYEITGGKVHLTKFKDVYSDKKISKFYLASRYPSTLTFDGMLDVQVRFKQSTLLLKIAELFTINVRGDLKKPIYSLQRQKYLMQQQIFTSESEGSL